MTIRPAYIEDLNALTELFDLYMQFYRKPTNKKLYRSFLRERIETRDGLPFLAIDNGRALGYMMLYYGMSSVSLGRIVVLNDLYILESHRSQNIGSQLIHTAFDYAKKIGAIRVDIETERTNTKAFKLYKSLGFVVDDSTQHLSKSI